MPGKIGVKIKAGRNLPIMDRTNETTDAYVEIKLGNVTHKTDVCRKSLNPYWNSDWFRFELDDAELQDEPLQIRLMDHDTYSANDAIGKVNINLNPLCLDSTTQQGHSKGNVLSGWIPVFDTMHGIRGEVNIVVKVDLFSDVNKFRQSSCGVQFFHSPCVPVGYRAQFVHGFVEELVVNDDPEYQWIDKIRTPRASNEARQMVFLKLSSQVQRKIGLKAINMGANAVIGYKQCFDLEGDVGVVARGIGTAVTLIKETNNQNGTTADNILLEESQDNQDSEKLNVFEPPPQSDAAAQSSGNNLMKNKDSAQLDKACYNPISQISPTKSILSNGQCCDTLSNTTSSVSTNATIIQKDFSDAGRRSSDSDISITPKGNSVSVGSERLMGVNTLMRIGQPTSIKGMNNEGGFDMLEYPFLTLNKYPPGFILSIGATVAARSVKLLERVPNPDEPEVRDSWWTELRMEIRSHARALGCNVVLGYTESTTISDDVCVLSATGTAAVIDMAYNSSISLNDLTTTTKPVTDPSDDQHYKDNSTAVGNIHGSNGSFGLQKKYGSILPSNTLRNPCNICHIVYNQNSMPFSMKLKKCSVCGKGKVPDVLLSTLEVPDFLPVTGRGSFVQAQVVRCKKDLRAESNAKEISDGLPFLEYELHRVLINKLKAKGMNGIFGLKTQVAIGERMISLIATGTAIFLTALPTPHVPKIVGGNSWTDKQKLIELQKKLQETLEKNQEIFQLKPLDPDSANDKNSDSEESEEETTVEVDLNFGNKDTCILEVDDIEDLEIISLIMEPYPPEGFYVVNTQSVPNVEIDVVKNVQMFTQVWRARLDIGQNVIGFQKHFQRILQTIYFKLRSMMPCMICDLKFKLDLPESDQIQLLVNGIAISASESTKNKNRRRIDGSNASHETNLQTSESQAIAKTQNEEELIFPLDEENVLEMKSNNMSQYLGQAQKLRKPSPSRTLPKLYNSIMHKRNIMLRDRTAIEISPLYSIPGRKIDKYLGNLNFFFIRESTSIRENGGISGFVHSFITELLAVVRAHIAALGGNAMVSFYMTELILLDNQHKNQGQCLISIGGDAVYTTTCNAED